MNFIERAIGMFTKPEATIKDILKEPKIEEAILIVGLYAIIGMLYAYLSASHINVIYNMPELQDMGFIKTVTMVTTLAMGLIVPLIAWPIVSGILHLFSMAFGGDGKFYPNILTSIGYTEIVKILLLLVALLLITQAPTVTYEVSTSNPYGGLEAMSEFYKSPFYILSNVAMLIGLFWSSYLGVLAIKNGEKLSMTQALIVVGLPLLIYIAITYGSLLLAFL
jgi:hypothetical protein